MEPVSASGFPALSPRVPVSLAPPAPQAGPAPVMQWPDEQTAAPRAPLRAPAALQVRLPGPPQGAPMPLDLPEPTEPVRAPISAPPAMQLTAANLTSTVRKTEEQKAESDGPSKKRRTQKDTGGRWVRFSPPAQTWSLRVWWPNNLRLVLHCLPQGPEARSESRVRERRDRGQTRPAPAAGPRPPSPTTRALRAAAQRPIQQWRRRRGRRCRQRTGRARCGPGRCASRTTGHRAGGR